MQVIPDTQNNLLVHGTGSCMSAPLQYCVPLVFWWLSLLLSSYWLLQYIPRKLHTVFALLCFVVVIHWLIFPYPSGILHWHCGNLTIAPVPAKQPWWIWINTSCEFIMNDCITTTKQSTTKPCAYFLGYTVCSSTCAYFSARTTYIEITLLLVTDMHCGGYDRNVQCGDSFQYHALLLIGIIQLCQKSHDMNIL